MSITRHVVVFLSAIVLLAAVSVVFAQDPVVTESEQPADTSMTIWQAAVLGVVEGVTEYLPVSSTGHLILTQRAMGLGTTAADEEAANAYAICIQAGAIMAVLGLYLTRVKLMLLGVVGKSVEGRRMTINVIAGFIPAAVIGLMFDDLIEQYLFGLWPIVVAWLVGGIAILIVARRKGKHEGPTGGLDLEQLTWKQAMVVGLLQCVAMWPGTSRSLMTIVGGVVVGLNLAAAVEFSFLLGLVTLSAATAYETLKSGQVMLEMYGFTSLAVGFVTATVSAVIAVKWMVAYLNKHGLEIFGYYRVLLALIIGGLLLGGVMS